MKTRNWEYTRSFRIESLNMRKSHGTYLNRVVWTWRMPKWKQETGNILEASELGVWTRNHVASKKSLMDLKVEVNWECTRWRVWLRLSVKVQVTRKLCDFLLPWLHGQGFANRNPLINSVASLAIIKYRKKINYSETQSLVRHESAELRPSQQ